MNSNRQQTCLFVLLLLLRAVVMLIQNVSVVFSGKLEALLRTVL